MFGKRIKSLRLEKQLRQKDLGDVFGVSESTIGMYERGQRQPDPDTIKEFARYFEVSTDYLLGNSNLRIKNDLSDTDEKDISKTLTTLMDQIRGNENSPLNYDGIELTEQDTELLEDAIEIALRRIKRKNKDLAKETKDKLK